MIVTRILARSGIAALHKRMSDLPYLRAISKDKIAWSKTLYKLMTRLYKREFEQHYKFIKNQSEDVTKSLLDSGFSLPSDDIKALISEVGFKSRFDAINWDGEDVNKYKPWMWYCEPQFDKDLVRLATRIANELSGYLCGLPVLQSAYFWKSKPYDGPSMGSQHWHIDNNDFRQIRYFIALNDIDENNGALEYISVGQSKQIYDEFERIDPTNCRNKKRDAQELERFQPEIRRLCAKEGESYYIDVGNCYHRGSRKMSTERHVFVLQFMTPFHIDSKIINRTSCYGVNENLMQTEEEKLVFKYYGNNYIKSEKYSKGKNNSKWYDHMKK